MRLFGIALFVIAVTSSSAAFGKPPVRARGAPATKAPKKTAPPPPAEVEEIAPPPPPAPPSARPAETTPAKDVAESENRDTTDEAERPISVAPVLGYASAHLSLGVGLRGGYRIAKRFYVGGSFVYHIGTSEKEEAGRFTVESSVRVFYPGVEGGYEIPVGPVVIRPYLGVGALFVAVSTKTGDESSSDTKSALALWPGCTVTYDFPRSSMFVGGDTRVLFATSGGDPSFGVFATGGMRF